MMESTTENIKTIITKYKSGETDEEKTINNILEEYTRTATYVQLQLHKESVELQRQQHSKYTKSVSQQHADLQQLIKVITTAKNSPDTTFEAGENVNTTETKA